LAEDRQGAEREFFRDYLQRVIRGKSCSGGSMMQVNQSHWLGCDFIVASAKWFLIYIDKQNHRKNG